MPYLNLLLFAASCVALSVSGAYLVKALVNISGFLRVREFVVAFILIAISTSLPELFVSATSALEQDSTIGLGTAIGSNIADIAFVFGVVLLIRGSLSIKEKTVIKNAVYTFGMLVLPIILMLDQELSRLDGFLLIGAFFVYITKLIREEHMFRAKEKWVPRRVFLLSIVMFVMGVIALILSANAVVHFARALALDIGIPEIIVALFMIALGTSLPELFFETSAVHTKHEYMAVGDLLGSISTNSALVLGITAVIFPIRVVMSAFLFSAIYMLLLAVMFFYLIVNRHHITWRHGLIFLLLYILYISIELLSCPSCHL